MKNIELLDCTLRDGGYVNDWHFGRECIIKIARDLILSGLEHVECGFLTDGQYGDNFSLFNSADDFKRVFNGQVDTSKCVLMIKTGSFDCAKLPPSNDNFAKTLRVIFKKSQSDEAFDCIKHLLDKGYNVFVNPTFVTLYNENEFEKLLNNVNMILPHAFSIVDSIGALSAQSLEKYAFAADGVLDSKISLCLHTHNSMQLSFSNACAFFALNLKRNLIVDSSLYGMGRGAGNLPTESICDYLNQNYSKEYDMPLIYSLLDTCISHFYKAFGWGFSLKYYLCAKFGLHPDYALYLFKTKNLPLGLSSKVLRMIPDDRKDTFDISLIENLCKQAFEETQN